MTGIKKARRAALVLLWLATVTLVVLWDRSPAAFVVSGFGLLAMLFAFSARGWWPWLAGLCSAGFIANWALAFGGSPGTGSPAEVYLAVIQGAMAQDAVLDRAIVLSYELVLPLLHLVTFLFLCAGLFRSKRGG